MPEWITAYNLAGVKTNVNPAIREIVSEFKHNFIVCSDLARSVHSAKVMGYPSPHLIDATFRESELPEIQIPLIRLTPNRWSIVFRLFWFAGVSIKAEPLESFKQRVSKAAEKLIQLAQQHDSILFIGHGIFNRLLEQNLISKGWIKEAASDNNKYWRYKYWEYSTYTKTQPDEICSSASNV